MRRTSKNKTRPIGLVFVFSLFCKIGFEPLGSSVKKMMQCIIFSEKWQGGCRIS